MEEIVIRGNLIVGGDLICGKDGILEANRNITFCCKDSEMNQGKSWQEIIPSESATNYFGSMDISGKKVIVHGGVFVGGKIDMDMNNYTGHITAGSAL